MICAVHYIGGPLAGKSGIFPGIEPPDHIPVEIHEQVSLREALARNDEWQVNEARPIKRFVYETVLFTFETGRKMWFGVDIETFDKSDRIFEALLGAYQEQQKERARA